MRSYVASSISKTSIHLVRSFSPTSTIELPKLTSISNYAINMIENKQTLFGPIYSLEPVELGILKTYVEINLANGLIRPSKLQVENPILFLPRKDGSLWLSPRPYQTLCFIALDLTNVYIGRRLMKATNWRQLSGPVTVTQVSNHALSNTRFKDPGQPHVKAVRWVLDDLRKYSLFANLKKC